LLLRSNNAMTKRHAAAQVEPAKRRRLRPDRVQQAVVEQNAKRFSRVRADKLDSQ
jgi:hypothetical protein